MAVSAIWLVMPVFSYAMGHAEYEEFAADAESTTNQVGIVAYIIGSILGAFLSLFAYLLDWVIQFSNEIIYLNAVQNGWQIVLSFANLGFVLAIIVIAFATILRLETYAMKKTLWKLIVAALLVNFSMVIAGGIISVSKIATDIFLGQMTFENFSDSLAQSMNVSAWGETKDVGAYDLITGGFSYLLKWFASIIFVIIFTFLTIFAMAGLFVMFLIRAAALIFLLILSPLAWLAWILPSTEKHWKTWWEEFIRWNIFAPASLFFVYLAMEMSKNLKDSTSLNIVSSNKAAEALGETILLSNSFINYLAQLFVVLAMLFGGLYVANKLGVAGGGLAYGWAQGAGKWAGGAVKRRSLKTGFGITESINRWRQRRQGIKPGEEKSIAERTSTWAAKNPRLAKWAGIGLAAQGVAKLSAAAGENLVKESKKKASERSFNENIAKLSYANKTDRAGILSHLQEKDLLDKTPDASKYIDKKYKNEFASIGQSVVYDKIQKSLGMDVDMKMAIDNDDPAAFDVAAEKFFRRLSKEERKKLPYDEIYGRKPPFGLNEKKHKLFMDGFTKSFLMAEPGNARNIIMGVKSKDLDTAEMSIRMAASEIGKINPELSAKIKESIEHSLGKRILGWEEETAEVKKEIKETKEEVKKEKSK